MLVGSYIFVGSFIDFSSERTDMFKCSSRGKVLLKQGKSPRRDLFLVWDSASETSMFKQEKGRAEDFSPARGGLFTCEST